MDEFTFEKLSPEEVNLIVRFIDEKRAESDLKELYVNSLLREDILTLLDRYCTVIYYPAGETDRENNHGFHNIYPFGRSGRDEIEHCLHQHQPEPRKANLYCCP